ncbi:MAG: hypothetical protein EBR23_06565 [Planctomycetia bacterium]|nr:hypothetical protein [Planctomycetia bacterium]
MAFHAEDAAQSDRDGGVITDLLCEWQEGGDAGVLATLVCLVRSRIESTARASLCRGGCRSRAAVDEVTSLVLDHLRRLPGVAGSDKAVAAFIRQPDAAGQTGMRYVVWLTQMRTKDCLRSRRRRARRSPTVPEACPCHGSPLAEGDLGQERTADRTGEQRDLLNEAIDTLDDASRGLMNMLLEGMSQVSIAESLGVCEGTVSRRRVVIIERLKREVAGRLRLPR